MSSWRPFTAPDSVDNRQPLPKHSASSNIYQMTDRSVKDKGIASSLTGVKTSMGPNKCKQVVDNMDNNQCQNGSTMMLCESRDGQMLGMRLVASLERLVLTILSTRKVRRLLKGSKKGGGGRLLSNPTEITQPAKCVASIDREPGLGSRSYCLIQRQCL